MPPAGSRRGRSRIYRFLVKHQQVVLNRLPSGAVATLNSGVMILMLRPVILFPFLRIYLEVIPVK